MTEINWNVFKLKYNGRETAAFELLAYMLFCSEHQVKVGIFRFKHQTGIETEPIIVDDVHVGFQSKYYETKLADNKTDIIDSITKAKTKNPQLNKIFLYTNKEFSESPQKKVKKPQHLDGIEEAARKINITIEWRVPSHIERQLLEPENKYLLQYFFDNGPSITDFIGNIYEHSKHVIFAVNRDIPFRAGHICVDRNDYIKKIAKSTSKITILSGDGGSGKTAIIKSIFSIAKEPFYVLKAVEFERQGLQDIFSQFGQFTFHDFLDAHKAESVKTFVIDSAEKLADLDDLDIFTQFLSALIQDNWKIIFTTRNTYLDNLTFQMLSVYRAPFETIKLPNLGLGELQGLSSRFDFPLPNDPKLASMICNLFYLNEYLLNVDSIQNDITAPAFRDVLWNKKILNAKTQKSNIHLARERCFLSIARRRSESGIFFIPTDIGDPQVLSLLAADEIIKYEETRSSYFIAHDIYEEWALEKMVDNAYNIQYGNADFFANIGNSLPTRRAFRSWLSNKLSDMSADIKIFIDGIYNDPEIVDFWKDEVLVSVLLSDYSREFFSTIEPALFADNKKLLQKLIFLLRTACKEVDETVHSLLSFSANEPINPATVFTKPKGKGWGTIIDILFKQIGQIAKEDLGYALPLLEDWTSACKFGETTKKAGHIALHFYKDSEADNGNYYDRDTDELLLKTVIACSRELISELTEITSQIVETTQRIDRYHGLQEMVLTSNNTSLPFIICMPENTIRLARKDWTLPPPVNRPFYYSSTGIDQYYGLATAHHYFPASALQTPVYLLLRFATADTLIFVLEIVNNAVTKYANSGHDDSIYQTTFRIDGEEYTQYASRGIWQIYRGTSSPVTPYILQSIHMALEKYLLEKAKQAGAAAIKNILLWLLKESKSVSITAVVSSVVLANAEDLFDIAIILFGNYDFFKLDNVRLGEEAQALGLYSIGGGLNWQNKVYENERISTCEDPHRKTSLEHQAIQYQFFRSEKISEAEADARKASIWKIIDEGKAVIEAADQEKVIAERLFYARIDRRSMSPIFTRSDSGVQIDFNPGLSDELKQFSQEGLRTFNEQFKHTPLKMWALHEFDQSKGKGDYTQYDNNPAAVLKEVKELLAEPYDPNDIFYYRYHEVPAYACAALIKSYESNLVEADIDFCIEILLDFASAPLRENYDYQISDGVEVAISTLPYIMKINSALKDHCISILLFVLFDEYPIGRYKRVCDYVIETINQTLFQLSPKNANEIIAAYVILKPQFDLWLTHHPIESRQNTHIECFFQFFNAMIDKYESVEYFSEIFDVNSIDELSVNNQEIIFQCIPVNTDNEEHFNIIQRILFKCGKELILDKRTMDQEEKYEMDMKRRFFKKYAAFLLQRREDDLSKWLDPIFEPFTPSRQVVELLADIVSIQDISPVYDNFWLMWKYVYVKIKDGIIKGRLAERSDIISNFMLAWPYWKDTAKSWHSLKATDAAFFKQVCKEIGSHPRVLYSIAKFLNEIGSDFIDEGAVWISDMIADNNHYRSDDVDSTTIYYLELTTRRYVYRNRTLLRSNRVLKDKLIILLNFLITKGSVNAYLLREDMM